LPWDEWRRV